MKKTLLLLAAIAPATAVAQIASTDSIATHDCLLYANGCATQASAWENRSYPPRSYCDVWSASAHYDVTKQLHVGANFRNIFSEYYTEKDGYHMPGRSIQFSASYRF